MCNLYSLEAYHYDYPRWEDIGVFFTQEDANKAKELMSKQYPNLLFSVAIKEICGTFENFCKENTRILCFVEP